LYSLKNPYNNIVYIYYIYILGAQTIHYTTMHRPRSPNQCWFRDFTDSDLQTPQIDVKNVIFAVSHRKGKISNEE